MMEYENKCGKPSRQKVVAYFIFMGLCYSARISYVLQVHPIIHRFMGRAFLKSTCHAERRRGGSTGDGDP